MSLSYVVTWLWGKWCKGVWLAKLATPYECSMFSLKDLLPNICSCSRHIHSPHFNTHPTEGTWKFLEKELKPWYPKAFSFMEKKKLIFTRLHVGFKKWKKVSNAAIKWTKNNTNPEQKVQDKIDIMSTGQQKSQLQEKHQEISGRKKQHGDTSKITSHSMPQIFIY